MSDDQNKWDKKIEISSEDLQTDAVAERVNYLTSAGAPQIFRSVGTPESSQYSGAGKIFQSSVFTLGLAGLAGGAAGALVTELVAQPDSTNPWYGNSAVVGTIIWLGVYAIVLGAFFSGWAGIEARSAAKFGRQLLRALPTLIAGAIAGGWIAQVIYSKMFSDVITNANNNASSESEFTNMVTSGLHLPRAIAFAIAGVGIGFGVGAAKRAWRPILNGVIGGAVGGFIGGYLFDYVGQWLNSGFWSRLIAFTLTGVMIGVATGLVEAATKQHWLEIVSGGMAGKQFIIYESKVSVGTSPSCGITLIKDPSMAPEHLMLATSGDGLAASPLTLNFPVLVNGVVISSHRLGDSDLIQIGSTILRYRSKDEAMPSMVNHGK